MSTPSLHLRSGQNRTASAISNNVVTVFVYIDDWLKPYQSLLPQQPAQKASYSELLTIAIVGEILAQPKDGFAGSLRIVWTFRPWSSKNGSA